MAASTAGDELYESVELLLKGPEISLVVYGQPPYADKDGFRREKARVRWWVKGEALSCSRNAACCRLFLSLWGRRYSPGPFGCTVA